METLIAKPKIKELEKILYRPIVKHTTNSQAEILRISNEDDLTRIDFIYYPKPNQYGWWVQIDKGSFICSIECNLRLTLVKAVNISIAPTKTFFKSNQPFVCYTLYFPPIAKGTESIDIVEREGSGGDWFNFYGVSMERARTEKLIVRN